MQPTKSDLLELIYAEAETLRKKYRSSSISQVHVLCALIVLSLKGEEKVRSHPEMVEAIGLLPFEASKLAEILQTALNSLKNDPLTSYEEVVALKDCYEFAEINASLSSLPNVTAPILIKKLLESPSEKVSQLFDIRLDTENKKPLMERILDTDEEEMASVLGEIFDKKAEQRPVNSFDDGLIQEKEEDETNLTGIIAPIKRMQNRIRRHIYGQDEAIFSVVSGYFNSLVRETQNVNKNQPRATFLFAGAPGVGKTYLARIAAGAMHLPFRRFDMSSYSDKEAPLEFSGSDKVYKNGHEGQVTGFVREHPRCVLLFDEIEKAHINIIHLFLQILDAGHLKDSHTGENISFKDAIIIMTTNAGKSLYDNLEPGAPLPSRKVILNALSTEVNPITGNKFFPEAICSRFAAGNIVLFNPLGAEELLSICKSCLEAYIKDFKSNFKLDLSFDDNLCAALLFAEGGQVDARALKGRASNFISSELYNWIRFADEKSDIRLNKIKEIKICTDIGTGDTAKLFTEQKKPTILLYSENPQAFAHFSTAEGYDFIVPKTLEEAEKLIATEEIGLAICDILGNAAATLNIEDIASSGRRLMDTLTKERIPVFIYSTSEHIINNEERQALTESGASGFFEQGDLEASLKSLKSLCKRVHSEKMLFELGRVRKVLTFDCTYDWDGGNVGIINLKNMRIFPAIDVQDQKDIADITATDTTFDSIIGAEDAKAALKGFISYLKEPRAYAKNAVPAPKGIILYGPPGTGKTMLAKALAHESGATFIATEGNRFLSGKIGMGAREVKRLFAMARKYAPSVLFIDEIDIVAKDRMSDSVAGDVVNALINEMDGFSTNTSRPVFVLAATNFDVSFGHKSALDPALLRRFDRRIFVDLPNRQERTTFIKNRISNSKQELSNSIIKNIALRSTGMSLAELESVIDFALRSMLQRGQSQLTDQLFDEAFETYRFGEKTDWDEALLKRVAIHEAGHAVLSYLCGNKPTYITVSGRSNFGGYMQSDSTTMVHTKKHLLGNIRTALAGRAAEVVFFGEEEGVSTSAMADIKDATQVAMQMITAYGMSTEHGIMFDDNPAREETIQLCNNILADEFDSALAIINENYDKVQRLADALISKNHLIGQEIEKILTE